MKNNKKLQEYDHKKYWIRHFKTPDHTIKNDCLIRALSEVTGRTYYNICQKLKVHYIANVNQHSVSDEFPGISLGKYYRIFGNLIQQTINLSSDPYSWNTIEHEAIEGKLPTVEKFAKAWSRRKQYSKSKLILHCFSLKDDTYHSIYCKNGYYYDSNNSDKMIVVSVDIFK